MKTILQKRKIWFTWESQRRNRELSQAFGATLVEINLDKLSRFRRYSISIFSTLKAILEQKPDIVFAQCPSIVLGGVCLLLRPIFGFTLVLDAHNAAIENLSHPNFFLRFISQKLVSLPDFIIVSNLALKEQISSKARQVLVLPDKLPQLNPQNEIFEINRPAIVYISSFAKDEPTEQFLNAFKKTDSDFTLYVTGKRTRAKDLLRYECDNVVFTDYLPHEVYDRLIMEADLLVDLTTRQDCLVCGAYEALAAGRPCVLSDSQANRLLFPSGGFLFTKNDENSLAITIKESVKAIPRLSDEIKNAQTAFSLNWNRQFENVQLALEIKE